MEGSERSNKKKQLYKIILYKGRKDKHHYFDIEFLTTRNKELVTYSQITNRTCYDKKQLDLEKRIKKEADLKVRNKQKKENKSTYNLTGLNTCNVLSIDLATRETGLAFSQNGEIKDTWHLSIPKELKDARSDLRAYWMADRIRSCVEKFNVDVILLEGVYLGLNSSILQILAEARGILLGVLLGLDRDVRVEILPAAKWKGCYPDLKGKKRQEQKKTAIELAEAIMSRKLTEDQADAVLLIRAALQLEGINND